MDAGQRERAPAGQLLSSASHWRRSPRSPPIEARASQRPINAPAADVPRDQHTIFIGRLGRFQPPPTPPSTPHPTHHLTPPHPSRTAHLHKYLVACSRKKKKEKKRLTYPTYPPEINSTRRFFFFWNLLRAACDSKRSQ